MNSILGLLIAMPAVTLALYVFTRMFAMLLVEELHTAVKLFAGITMVCAILTACLAIAGSRDVASLLQSLVTSQ